VKAQFREIPVFILLEKRVRLITQNQFF